MAESVDIDKTEETEAVEEEWQRDRDWSICQRIHACASELGFLEKDKSVKMKGGGYEYISHDAVTQAVRGPMLKYGIMVAPTVTEHAKDGNRTELRVNVRFVNVDKPADYLDIDVWSYGVDPSDKGPGKAMSYALKTAYLKVFMLNSADDIELDTTEHDPSAPRRSDIAIAQNEANRSLEAWANEHRAQINAARSLEELEVIIKDRNNKRALSDCPETTVAFFNDLYDRRREELADA